MSHLYEIKVALSESEKIVCPQRPLTEIFELIYRYSMKLRTVYKQMRPETEYHIEVNERTLVPL